MTNPSESVLSGHKHLLGTFRRNYQPNTQTVVWAYLLVLIPGSLGLALLVLTVREVTVHRFADVVGFLVYGSLAFLFLWGTAKLLNEANRVRHLRIGLYAEGLTYSDNARSLPILWDQIETLSTGGGTSKQTESFRGLNYERIVRSYQYTLLLKDGTELTFYTEIVEVDALVWNIFQHLIARGSESNPGAEFAAKPSQTADHLQNHSAPGARSAAAEHVPSPAELPEPFDRTKSVKHEELEEDETPEKPPHTIRDSTDPDGTESRGQLVEFQRTLGKLTPHVRVTPLLLATNVTVFVLMVVSGISPIQPKIPELLRWGANFGPSTLGGEWWRMLTCMFVHIGVLHLLFNMWILTVSGPLVERMVGNVGFLLMYLVAGLIGSLASLFWNPMLVSAGASGAIFGIYGALLGLLFGQRESIPTRTLSKLRNTGLVFLGFNLIYGLSRPDVDNAAHIGGLLGGFLCGVILRQPFSVESLANRPLRNALVCLVGVSGIVLGMFQVYNRNVEVIRMHTELKRFAVIEMEVLNTFNNAAKRADRRELSDAAFADLLERDVLPKWQNEQKRLSALDPTSTPLRQQLESILNYVRLRQEGWELFVRGLREGNSKKIELGIKKQEQAQAIAERTTRGNDN